MRQDTNQFIAIKSAKIICLIRIGIKDYAALSHIGSHEIGKWSLRSQKSIQHRFIFRNQQTRFNHHMS